MEEIKKIPEIRFDGFSDDWNIDTFENLTSINQGLQISIANRYLKRIPNSHFYITNEFLKEGAKSEYYILNPPESVLCTKDDVLMTRTGNTGEVVTDVNGAFHNNFFKIDFDRKVIDKDYLVHFLKNDSTKALILNLAGVSTIPDLNHNDFYQIAMPFPDIDEQIKISSTLNNLDNLIKNHNTQLKKLTNLKKAMLIKMFPQDGASVPEIRFKGFDGDWEIKTFKDIFNYHRPDPYIVSSTEYSNEYSTAVLTANKAFVLGYTNEESTFNQLSIIFDDFTLDCKYVDFPFMVKSSALKILTIKNSGEFDLYFSYQLLKYTDIEVLGHARHYIGIVQPTEVLLPNIDEQENISDYFKNLDNLISNHKEQLKKLNQIKQACLSKLFVSQD